MSKLLRIVEQTITDYEMFEPKDSVLVGVSGGPDSVALLQALITLTPKFDLRLGVAHLNHSLRLQESDNDARFVASLADKFDLPFYIQKVDVRKFQIDNKLSPEEAARRLRYNFYWETASKNGFNKIALGHHCDDNAELILMNLFRGSGPLGIAGIPPKRDEQIVRPLIRLKRSDIIEFLESKELKYVSDRSNLDPKYLRNRIRHHLIPLLQTSYNPKIIETLNRLASIISLEEKWLDDIIQPVFNTAVLTEQENNLGLSVPKLDGIHPAALRRVMRKAIQKIKGNLRRITYVHIDSATRLLEKEPGNWSLDLPDRVRIRRRESVLFISKETKALRDLKLKSGPDEPLAFEYHITQPETIFVKEINAKIKFSEIRAAALPDFRRAGHQTGFFDMNRLSFPLVIRSFRPGDRFTPLGMRGTQKVKKFFINQKVPKDQRSKCPILLSQGKIIWVAGYRIDESVKVMPSTDKVLRVELLLA